jgi:peptidoglycan/LPS O-acetylase OafA/YrhL
MTTASQSSKYRPEIDGLRAIAVVSVLLFHAFPKRFPSGFIGVDIFFVISGFLITSIILEKVSEGTFSYLDFYSRRIKRIFPALLLVLTVTLVCSWYILLPDEFKQVSGHVAAGASFLANFAFWRESGYFDTAADTKPLLHLWSLAVEEQFYILWPVLISLLFAKSRKSFLIVASALGVLSFLGSLYLSKYSPTAAFYSPWSRFWELCVGGLLAAVPRTPQGLGNRASNIKGWLGAAMLIGGFVLISKADAFPGWVALMPVLGSALLISAGPEAAFCKYVLSNRLVVFVGLISYPLYLWHWPLLILPKIAIGENLSNVAKLGSLGASVVLAVCTYYFAEGKLRHSKSVVVPRSLAMAMFAFFVIGLGASVLGFTSRHQNADLNRILNAKLDWEYPARGFQALGRTGHQFWYQNSNVADKTIFIGDSNMEQYAPRISKVLTDQPNKANSVIFATRGNCSIVPLLYEKEQSCKNEMARAMSMARAPDVKVVVFGQLWLDHPQLASDISLQQSLTKQLKDLAASKRVYVILNIPAGPAFNPKNMFSGTRLTTLQAKDPTQIKFDMVAFKAAIDPLTLALRNIAKESGAILIDPVQSLCNASGCPVFDKNNDPMYLDNTHIRASYAEEHIQYLDFTVLSGEKGSKQ